MGVDGGVGGLGIMGQMGGWDFYEQGGVDGGQNNRTII